MPGSTIHTAYDEDKRPPGVSPLFHLAADLIKHNAHGKLHELLVAQRQTLDVDEVDNLGWTLLLHAAWHGKVKCVETLLEFGSRIEHANKDGDTALHFAYQKKFPGVATLLIQANGPEKLQNGRGLIPKEMGGDDTLKRKLFHWRVCEGLDASRHFPKPTMELLHKQQEEAAPKRPDSPNPKKSFEELVTFYKPDDAGSRQVRSRFRSQQKRRVVGGKTLAKQRHRRHLSADSNSQLLCKQQPGTISSSSLGTRAGAGNILRSSSSSTRLSAKACTQGSHRRSRSAVVLAPTYGDTTNHKDNSNADLTNTTETARQRGSRDRFEWLRNTHATIRRPNSPQRAGPIKPQTNPVQQRYRSGTDVTSEPPQEHTQKSIDSQTPNSTDAERQQSTAEPPRKSKVRGRHTFHKQRIDLIQNQKATVFESKPIGDYSVTTDTAPGTSTQRHISTLISSGSCRFATPRASPKCANKSTLTPAAQFPARSATVSSSLPQLQPPTTPKGSRAEDLLLRGEFWSPQAQGPNNEGNVYSWKKYFQKEQGAFASKHVFAQMKLEEALLMLHTEDVSPRAMTSLLVFLLAELEPTLSKFGRVGVFSATYTLFSTVGASNPSSSRDQLMKAAQLMVCLDHVHEVSALHGRRTCTSPTKRTHHYNHRRQSDNAHKGSDSLREHMRAVQANNSASESAVYLRQRYEEEMAVRPLLQEGLQRQRRIQYLEQTAINRMVERSDRELMRRVHQVWRGCVAKSKRLHAIGMQLLLRRRANMVKTVFAHWRYGIDALRMLKSQERAEALVKQVTSTSNQRNKSSRRIQDIRHALEDLQDTLAQVTDDYEQHQRTLRCPTRNPTTLGHITMILCEALGSCCTTLGALADFQCAALGDPSRIDRGSLAVFSPPVHSQLQAQEWDMSAEQEMLDFIPGARGINEWTPAFDPFARRSGVLLLRWAKYHNAFVDQLDPTVYVNPETTPTTTEVAAASPASQVARPAEVESARQGTSPKVDCESSLNQTQEPQTQTPLACHTSKNTTGSKNGQIVPQCQDQNRDICETYWQRRGDTSRATNAKVLDRFERQTSISTSSSLSSGKVLVNLCAVLHSKGHNQSLPCVVVDECLRKAEQEERSCHLARKKPSCRNSELKRFTSRSRRADTQKALRVARCERLLQQYKQVGFLHSALVGFAEGAHLVMQTPKKSEGQLEREQQLRQRLSADSDSTPLSVRFVSKYFSHRTPLQTEPGPQRLFAFLAFLFTTFPCVKPDACALRAELEEKIKKFRKFPMTFGKLLATFSRKRLPVDHEVQTLIAIATGLTEAHSALLACDTTTNFSKAVTLTYRDARQFGELLDHAVFVAWQSSCLLVLSRTVHEEIDVDDGTYTSLEPAKLKPVLQKLKLDVHGLETTPRALQQIGALFKRRLRDLKRVFAHYCASQPGDVMSVGHVEFWKFIKAIRVQADTSKHHISSPHVDLIFQQYCATAWALTLQQRRNNGRDTDTLSPFFSSASITDLKKQNWTTDGALHENDFVHILVLLAARIFPSRSSVPLEHRVQILLERYVLPHACAANIDVFRDRFYLQETQAELEANKFLIFAIFDFYSAADQSDAAALRLYSLNLKEFMAFAEDAGIMGPTKLSYIATRTVFAYVQQDSSQLRDAFAAVSTTNCGGHPEDDTGKEMVMREFLEALAAISVWIEPCPFKTVAARLRSVLQTIIIPSLRNKSHVDTFLRQYRLPTAHKTSSTKE